MGCLLVPMFMLMSPAQMEAGRADVATASAMANVDGDWTAAHEKELGFAREKND